MRLPFQPDDPERFRRALERFDAVNAEDPRQETVRGQLVPVELAYAQRLTEWVLRLNPDASEPLRLAARCQHIRRWETPRDTFPLTREGYLRWRESLKRRHAEISGAILREVGYTDDIVARVQSLNLKRNLKEDRDCQTLEDALCLVFLEHQLPVMADSAPDEKLIGALRKCWVKMSPQGREAALRLDYRDRERRLLQEAVG